MKLALFRNSTYSFASDHPMSEAMEGNEDYARVSEYVEVKFPPLSNEAVIKQQLDAIDRTEQELRTKFQQRLNAIQDRRAELQSLTYVPAAE